MTNENIVDNAEPDVIPVEQDEQVVDKLPTNSPPNPYRFHRPAQKKTIDIPIPKPIEAKLLEDMPRKWERVCFRRFRKGDHITLTGMTFFPGIGSLYTFSEGSRGSYCVRPDQVSFEAPVANLPEKWGQVPEVENGAVVRQEPEV